MNFVRQFVFGEKLNMDHQPLCGRFRIGSSLIRKLIKGLVGVRDTHGDFFSGRNRNKGNQAENEVEMTFREDIVTKHPFLVSQDFPFICATPDFIFDESEGKLAVVEVKSGNTPSKAKANVRSIRSRYQLLTAMQIFGISTGRIIEVIRDEKKHSEEIGDDLELSCCRILFKHRKRIIKEYLTYLSHFFSRIYGIEISEEKKKELHKLLLERVPRKGKKREEATKISLRRRLWMQARNKKIACVRGKRVWIPHGIANKEPEVEPED